MTRSQQVGEYRHVSIWLCSLVSVKYRMGVTDAGAAAESMMISLIFIFSGRMLLM